MDLNTRHDVNRSSPIPIAGAGQRQHRHHIHPVGPPSGHQHRWVFCREHPQVLYIAQRNGPGLRFDSVISRPVTPPPPSVWQPLPCVPFVTPATSAMHVEPVHRSPPPANHYGELLADDTSSGLLIDRGAEPQAQPDRLTIGERGLTQACNRTTFSLQIRQVFSAAQGIGSSTGQFHSASDLRMLPIHFRPHINKEKNERSGTEAAVTSSQQGMIVHDRFVPSQKKINSGKCASCPVPLCELHGPCKNEILRQYPVFGHDAVGQQTYQGYQIVPSFEHAIVWKNTVNLSDSRNIGKELPVPSKHASYWRGSGIYRPMDDRMFIPPSPPPSYVEDLSVVSDNSLVGKSKVQQSSTENVWTESREAVSIVSEDVCRSQDGFRPFDIEHQVSEHSAQFCIFPFSIGQSVDQRAHMEIAVPKSVKTISDAEEHQKRE